jgi:hypothetical protein
VYLQAIQSELKAEYPDLNIEIIGVNQFDKSDGNTGITKLCTFPWLQDETNVNAWLSWQANKDDFFMVDSTGRLRGLFFLKSNDLSDPKNRETLKKMLLDAAVIKDSNNDGLPDDWIQQFSSDPAIKPNEDLDGDGRDNFTEYAFGTNPAEGNSSIPIKMSLGIVDQQKVVFLVFNRRAGSVLNYYIELSTNLKDWMPVSASIVQVGGSRNLYDGTGTSQVKATLKLSSSEIRQYLRVRAVPRGPKVGD